MFKTLMSNNCLNIIEMYIMINFHPLKAQTLPKTIEHPIRYIQVKNIGRLIVRAVI